jgi:hypothetical protein
MASKRFQVSWLGEYYMDCLAVEAVIKDRTKSLEASSLLCSMLQQREEKRRHIVEYLAQKRNISFDDMWKQMVNGSYEPLTEEEKKEIDTSD